MRANYSGQTRLGVMADLLAQGEDPEDVTDIAVLDQALVTYTRGVVDRKLSAYNILGPDESGPCPHPWQIAHEILDAIHAGLHGLLTDMLGDRGSGDV